MPKAPLDRPVAAVDRALGILDAFIEGNGRLSLTELETRTGLFKSVICRYMVSFEERGYVTKTAEGRYQLAPQVMRLGRSYEKIFNLADHVMPVLTSLSGSTRESASYYILDKGMRLCVYRVDSPRSLRVSVQPGSRLPLDKSATGQVLQHFSAAGQAPPKLSDDCIRHSSNVGPDETSSMSVPVFNRQGVLLGALTVSGPTSRFDPAKNLPARKKLLAAVKQLGEALGA